MKTNLKKAFLGVLAASTLGLGAPVAMAVPVDVWDYDVQSAFFNWTPVGPGAGAIVPGGENNHPVLQAFFPDNATTLTWGVNAQSGLTIEPSHTGQVTTNGAFEPGALITHNNFTISDPNNLSLATLDLVTALILNPFLPSDTNDDTVLGPLLFNVGFIETPNQTTPCPAGDPTPCDDIFVLLDPTDLVTFFDYDGETYKVTLDLNAQLLSDEQCEALGAAAGCRGLVTQENFSNEFQALFSIELVQDVPEPGTLALIGLALAGFGLRRKLTA